MTHDKRNLTEPLLDIFADRLHDLPQREALKGWHASPDPLAILAIGSEVIELRATVRQASPEEANDLLVD